MSYNNVHKKNNNVPSIISTIISNSNEKLRYGGKKKNAFRIQKNDIELKLDYEDYKNILYRSEIEVIKIISPNFGGSKSGKYDTWYCKYQNEYFNIVFGEGRNAGHKYEDDVVHQLQTALKDENVHNELFKTLLAAFKIERSEIREIIKVASKGVKRSINEDILNVGEIISDIDVIKTNGDKIHISLKNKNGDTFANIGYDGGFVVTIDKDNKKNINVGNHQLDDLIVDTLGIDKQKVVDGINCYIEQKNTTWLHNKIVPNHNRRKLLRYLGSAYGFGYWYIRPEKSQIYELRTVTDVINTIGEIKSVYVNYPYFLKENGIIKKSKQITVLIETDCSNYIIEIRNSHGEINPNEIKIKIK